MTEGRKKLLKWIGYPLLAVLTFVFAVHFTFPYDRARDRIVEALSKDFDVAILGIEPGWLPGRVVIEGLSLTTRPKREDEKPRTLMIERVDLALGLFALVGRTLSVDLEAQIGAGKLLGNVKQSSSGVVLDLRTEDVSLESVPGLEAITGGAPIVGPFIAKVKLSLPKGKWAGAGGGLELACAGCTLGDGVTKVRPMSPGQQNAFTSEGMTLPRIRLGTFAGKIQINKGVACIERFEARGGDVELTLEGGVKLADPFKDAQATLQARLKSSDAFRQSSVRNAALFTGVRDAEGFVTYVARNAPLLALRWLEARSPFTPLPECRGVAAPPSPSSTTGKPAVARTAAPQNPVTPPAPTGTATATPAGGTNGRTDDSVGPSPVPAPPAPDTPAPVANDRNDLQPSAAPPPPPPEPTPAAAPAVVPQEPPAAPPQPEVVPQAQPEPVAPPPPVAEQPQAAPQPPTQ